MPAVTPAIGLGPFRSMKPDVLHIGGKHNIRMMPGADGLKLRVVSRTRRTGLYVASTGHGAAAISRSRGTSCANALTTRAHLNAAAALTTEDGPFAGLELPRRDFALFYPRTGCNLIKVGGARARKIDGGLVRAGAQRQHGPQARPEAAFGAARTPRGQRVSLLHRPLAGIYAATDAPWVDSRI
jgi:hypothetical protein